MHHSQTHTNTREHVDKHNHDHTLTRMHDIAVAYLSAVWRKSVRSSSNQWLNLNRAWLKYEGPLHVVFYEHVKADTKKELTAMLEFLGFPTTYLHCALFNSNGNFHRKKAKKLDEDLYDKTLREIVDKRKRDIYSRALKRKRNR